MVSQLEELCAIIPAFNAADTIAEVVRTTREYVAEVMVIDDGSTDDTGPNAEAAGAAVVRHEINLGKGAGLRTGFRWAAEHGYETAVTLDADGQTDPAFIAALLGKYRDEGADVVVGSRAEYWQGMRWYRRIANWISSSLVSLSARQHIEDSQSGYRLVRVSAWLDVEPRSSGYEAESEFLIDAGRHGCKITSVPVTPGFVDGVPSTHYRAGRDSVRFLCTWLRCVFRKRWSGRNADAGSSSAD